MHKLSLLFLLEIKFSSSFRFSSLVKSIGFVHMKFVHAIGSADGIALLWKTCMDVRILTSNPNLINALVFSNPLDTL